MEFVTAFVIIPFAAILLIPFFKVNAKGIVLFTAILLNVLLSGYYAVQTLFGETYTLILPGSLVTGPIRLVMDALSGWFMLVINLVFLTGCFYGLYYLKAYQKQKNNISLHYIAFILLHTSLISLCAVQNSMVFLIAWEIMALSAFINIIFEHEKIKTIKAGINYLIQSHVAIIFLMLGFIWVAFKTGSYDFNSITAYTTNHQGNAGIALFICFFIAFAIKAGFVPFHTWLPHAHPAAPSHISGIMSGVIIKIGIFGILRMLLVIQPDYLTIGYLILAFSVVSGLYGVMLAIVQHNLKRLLAYHSIENIGIIGIGIGIGCIGLGCDNQILATLGFAGAMLHTLNHALFKSLLFYAAGNVYQSTHTLNVEKLGGLIKRMPQTSLLFLVAAIAICGIPPFNGFISEFIIYTGLYNSLHGAMFGSLIAIIFSITALVMIGGLALLCFTKAFGVVFLGTPRQEFSHEVNEVPTAQLIPLYLIAFLIVFIGLFPQFFMNLLIQPVNLMAGTSNITVNPFQGQVFEALQPIGWAVWGFVLLVALLFFLKKVASRNKTITSSPTWGCGYVAPTARQQYTANSFVRTYSKIFKAIVLSVKNESDIKGIFPDGGHYETHPYDKMETTFIDKPVRAFKNLMGKFLFLNNGRLQFYILYGIIFIVSVICFPFVYEKVVTFFEFLKQL